MELPLAWPTTFIDSVLVPHSIFSMFVDTFGRKHTYLRISVTERCNLRCTYCMPEEGVQLTSKDRILTFEEIERLARLFVRNGIEKIRLTGGEPLVRKNFEDLVERIGLINGLRGFAVTTNGMLLAKKIDRLKAAGINQLNISLDTLDPAKFERIARRPGLSLVLEAIDRALSLGYAPLKVNCVVMRGVNDDELVDFAAMTRDLPIAVRFIEYMPFSGNGWSEGFFVPYREMMERIEAGGFRLVMPDRGVHDTSRTFHIPGHAGSVGFIASMSDQFCAGCNRLRLTADGALKVCLFGRAETSLRDIMRKGASDDELCSAIQDAVLRKKASHAGMHAIAKADDDRPMILIGG